MLFENKNKKNEEKNRFFFKIFFCFRFSFLFWGFVFAVFVQHDLRKKVFFSCFLSQFLVWFSFGFLIFPLFWEHFSDHVWIIYLFKVVWDFVKVIDWHRYIHFLKWQNVCFGRQYNCVLQFIRFNRNFIFKNYPALKNFIRLYCINIDLVLSFLVFFLQFS